MSSLRLNYLQFMLRNHPEELSAQLNENQYLDYLQMVAEVVMTQQLETGHENNNSHYFEQVQNKISKFNERNKQINTRHQITKQPLSTVSAMMDCYDKNQYFLENVKHITNIEDRNRRPIEQTAHQINEQRKDNRVDPKQFKRKIKTKKTKKSISSSPSSDSDSQSSSSSRQSSTSSSRSRSRRSKSKSSHSRKSSNSASESNSSRSQSNSRKSSSSSSNIRQNQNNQQRKNRPSQSRPNQKRPKNLQAKVIKVIQQPSQPTLVIKPQQPQLPQIPIQPALYPQQSPQITIQKQSNYSDSSTNNKHSYRIKEQIQIQPPVSIQPQMVGNLDSSKHQPLSQLYQRSGVQNPNQYNLYNYQPNYNQFLNQYQMSQMNRKKNT